MKLQILSDIHLEFGRREFDFSEADLVVLAGDVHLGEKGIYWINEKIPKVPVIYILGNHEYYKHVYPKILNKIKQLAKDTNVHVLENNSVCFDGITFHGTTLWTDLNLFGKMRWASFECQNGMNDYKYIRTQPQYSKLKTADTLKIHYESLNWLEESLFSSTTKTNVVITHHAPSIKSVISREKDNLISAAYASNLDDFILKLKPNIWIHGHIHKASDYHIGETRIVSNPAGYPDECVDGFQKQLIIEIPT